MHLQVLALRGVVRHKDATIKELEAVGSGIRCKRARNGQMQDVCTVQHALQEHTAVQVGPPGLKRNPHA